MAGVSAETIQREKERCLVVPRGQGLFICRPHISARTTRNRREYSRLAHVHCWSEFSAIKWARPRQNVQTLNGQTPEATQAVKRYIEGPL
jgi:hypothetical protein